MHGVSPSDHSSVNLHETVIGMSRRATTLDSVQQVASFGVRQHGIHTHGRAPIRVEYQFTGPRYFMAECFDLDEPVRSSR
eukprot:7021692-Alexandrium_andersonii.AAC.2